MHPEQAQLYTAAVSDFRDEVSQRRAAHAGMSGMHSTPCVAASTASEMASLVLVDAQPTPHLCRTAGAHSLLILMSNCVFAAASTSGQERKAVQKLGARKINNIFVHLRKIAQHPLLVRSQYDDARLHRLADIAHRRCALMQPHLGHCTRQCHSHATMCNYCKLSTGFILIACCTVQ